jgi:hypothetical protein
VKYEYVNPLIKQANKDSALETIRTLNVFGLFLEAPAVEHDPGMYDSMKHQFVYMEIF